MPTRVFRGVDIVPLVSSKSTKSNLIIEAVREDLDLPNYILQKRFYGLTAQADKLIDIAKNEFSYGLPDGLVYRYLAFFPWVYEDAISNDIGEDVVVSQDNTYKVLVGLPVEDFFSKRAMVDNNYGYDPVTEILTAAPVTAHADATVTYFDSDFVAGSLEIIYKIQREDPLIEPTYQTVSEVLTDFYLTGIYYMVEYETVAVPGAVRYWTYREDLGTYPLLDVELIPFSGNTYYPNIVLRTGDTNIKEGDEDFDASIKALELFNLDYDTVIDSVITNETADDVQDVNLQFLVNLYTKDEEVLDYIWQYFKELEFYDVGYAIDYGSGLQAVGFNQEVSTKEFYFRIGCAIFDEEIHVGVLPERFTVERNKSYQTKADGRYEGVLLHNTYIYYIRKQLTPTTYSVIAVEDIQVRYYAKSDFSSPKRDMYTYVGIRDWFGEWGGDYPDIYIPLNKSTLYNSTNNPVRRNEVLKKTLSLYISIRSVQDLEWYETTYFATTVEFILNSLALISISSGNPGLTELILALADYYVYKYIIELALAFLIKEFGLEDTAIAIALLVVIAVVTDNLDLISGLDSLPWAEDFLQLTTAFLGALSAPMQDEATKLMEESNSFLKSAEERQEELDEAESLLSNNTDISIFDLHREESLLGVNESPTSFFDRAIHNANPGVKSLDSIKTYVSNVIRLPEPNESLI